MASADAKLLVLADKYNQLQQTIFAELEAIKAAHVNITKQEGPQGPVGPAGKDGRDGRDGVDGKNGRDGEDGRNGVDGKDGISVVDVNIDIDNSLVVKLSDGTEIDAGQIYIKAPEGQTVYNTGYSSITQETPVYAVRYDEIDSSTAYRGEAAPNTAEGTAAWRIQKIVIVNDDVTITWASGTTNFDKSWTSRLSYTYS